MKQRFFDLKKKIIHLHVYVDIYIVAFSKYYTIENIITAQKDLQKLEHSIWKILISPEYCFLQNIAYIYL